jgi:hypothetical protein
MSGPIRELHSIIQNDRNPLSPRIVALKEILGQLRPEPEREPHLHQRFTRRPPRADGARAAVRLIGRSHPMSNGLITDEQAKLGQEALKTLRGLGSFLDKALGSTPEDLIGYLGGDRLHIRRVENIVRMMTEARERLLAMKVEQTKPATLGIALPLLEAAADEDREELVDLWARLLANAMDPNLNSVRYMFIEAVKRMDPPDVLVLKYIHENNISVVRVDFVTSDKIENRTVGVELIATKLRRDPDEVHTSIRHLNELSLLDEYQLGRVAFSVNAVCREFLRACYPGLQQ